MVVAATVLAISCGKEEAEPDTRTTPADTPADTPIAGKQLVKMNMFSYHNAGLLTIDDYGFASGGWTDGQYGESRIQWTGNNITGISEYDFKNGAFVEDQELRVAFTYSNNRMTEVNTHDGTVYLTYTGDLLTEVYSGGYRQVLTYSNDGHLTKVATSNSGGSYEERLTWNGENVATIQTYYDGEWYSTTSFTYDSKKSPYTSMPIAAIAIAATAAIGDYQHLSENNVIREETTYNEYIETYIYAYTYIGEYPVKCVKSQEHEWNASYSEYTIYFEYSDGTKTDVPQAYTITTSAQVSDDPLTSVWGGGTYAQGKTAQLHARSHNYTFSRWSDGNTDNPRSITVNKNWNLTAVYE